MSVQCIAYNNVLLSIFFFWGGGGKTKSGYEFVLMKLFAQLV